jgi:hypothetical protein
MSTNLGPCQNIDEVITCLDQIIARFSLEHSRLGFFATLYRDVTIQVRQGITSGRFENGPRMERLDVIFANRYFDALNRHWAGEKPTFSWHVAFQAAHKRRPIILQHLLLGMNAHINLDLAIAAVEIAPGDELASLKRDFMEITVLLDEMIRDVQKRVEQVSPWIRILDHLGGRTDEKICAFAIGTARDLAWSTAEHLARLGPEDFEREVGKHDRIVEALGEEIRSPGWPLNLGLHAIRIREALSIDKVIAILRM